MSNPPLGSAPDAPTAPPQNPGSWQLTQMVLRHTKLVKSAEVMVATIIASYYDPKKGYASVATSEIMRGSRLSKRTVHYAVSALEESGEWIVDRGKWSNRYQPVIAKILDGASAPLEDSQADEDPDNAPSPSPEAATPAESLPASEEPAPAERKKASGRSYPAETDPCRDGLPLLPEANTVGVVNPPLLEDPQLLATRLYRRYNNLMKGKEGWSIPALRDLYGDLRHGSGASYEAIDILLWIQCSQSRKIAPPFLLATLSKFQRDGRFVWPEGPSTNPAIRQGRTAYKIWVARHGAPEEKANSHIAY